MESLINKNTCNKNICHPLSAEIAVASFPTLKEPKIIGEFIFWLEQRPEESGRVTAFLRPWKQISLEPQELTPYPCSLKTDFHGYGGGVIAVAQKNNLIITTWIDSSKKSLVNQTWKILSKINKEKSLYIEAIDDEKKLIITDNFSLGDGVIDLKRNRWIGVMEKNNIDYIIQVNLDKIYQKPKILYQGKSFIAYISIDSSFSKIAWVEWENIQMPWEKSELYAAQFDLHGSIDSPKVIAGKSNLNDKKISVFQPIWLENGEISISEDQSGWWNPIVGKVDFDSEHPVSWKRLWEIRAETAIPQWVSGITTIAFSSVGVIAAACKNGNWKLLKLSMDGAVQEISQPYNDISYVCASGRKVAFIAANSSHHASIIEIDIQDPYQSFLQRPFSIDNEEIMLSIPREIWFEGFKSKKTQALFYPPLQNIFQNPPLLVRSHSGPTAMASKGLNLEIQYWSSRGWSVIDVNYGGSTGFGRAYRDRIKENWGEVDVYDCTAAASYCIDKGFVNKDLIAIQGGSAGGFTALRAISNSNIFKVAMCKYAVADLLDMRESTHRFEKYYLNYLLGNFESKKKLYRSKSPLNNYKEIKCPVIFFQGLKDKVVKPSQTRVLFEQLTKNKVNVELHEFSNEGHGFKDLKNRVSVLQLSEKFFKKHLNI